MDDSIGRIGCERHATNPLEFGPLRCYISAMAMGCGWMQRITHPVLY